MNSVVSGYRFRGRDIAQEQSSVARRCCTKHVFQTGLLYPSWAHWGSESESWVTDAVVQFGDANSTTERFVIDADDGWGCDFHTNVVSNQKFGEQLAARIAAL